MKKVGYIFHDLYLEHKPSTYHPERPERLTVINSEIEKSGLYNKLIKITPEPAMENVILQVHKEDYYNQVKATTGGEGYLDPDTYYNKYTYDAAMMAAGGVLCAGRMVYDDELDSAFCAVRPPGHHAESSRSMGFCLFNNIAILAQWLIDERKLERIAILDWDGHHGNGTQEIFYSSNQVHYTSLHRYPFYPGTGSNIETGYGNGAGYNLNIPLTVEAGDMEFVNTIATIWSKAMDTFRPEITLLSAGFDAYERDPLVGLSVTRNGFIEAGKVVKTVALKHCNGKIISVLEGGYVLSFLGQAVVDHLQILLE